MGLVRDICMGLDDSFWSACRQHQITGKSPKRTRRLTSVSPCADQRSFGDLLSAPPQVFLFMPFFMACLLTAAAKLAIWLMPEKSDRYFDAVVHYWTQRHKVGAHKIKAA